MPIRRCILLQVHIIEKLMTVKLGRNYVILKKINAYWLLGTITYKTYKVAVPTMVNVFKHKPKHTDGYFLIGDKELSLTSFSF